MNKSLEQLYEEARSALKAKDYGRASDLLKQILVVDENYKDASRLLARIVREKRRRWYNHPALWLGITLVALIGLVIGIAPRIQASLSRQIPSLTQQPTVTQQQPAITQPLQGTAVSSPTPAPTPIPSTWSRLNLAQFLSRDNIHSIAINPSDPDVVYVGTLDAGVFKSIDGGISWQPAQNGMEGASIDTLVIDPQQPDTLYAALYRGGLYKTTDGGANWISITPEFDITSGNGSKIVIDPADHQHLYYAYAPGEPLESHDGGKTWPGFNQVACPKTIGALLLDPADQSLYASNFWNDGTCAAAVYRSGDHGRTWTLVGLQGVNQITGLYIGTDLHGNKLLIANGGPAEGPDAGHVYFSANQGKTWNMQAISCNAMAVDPETNTTFYCAETNGGVTKSTDGGSSWTSLKGLNGETFTAISVLAGSSPRLVVGGTTVAISTDQGISWKNYDGGLPGKQVDLTIDPSNASTLYLNYTLLQNQNEMNCRGLYSSKDAGHNWNLASFPVPFGGGCGLTFGPGGKDLYRAVRGGLYHSTDQGVHWNPLPIPSSCAHIYANPFIAGELVAGCDGRDTPTFYNSNDFGITWRESNGDNDGGLGLEQLYFGGNDGQRVYAIFAPNFFSNDGGKSWQQCSGEPIDWQRESSSSDSRLIIDPQNFDHLLEATEGFGVLISTDGCRDWNESNTGLDSLLVNSLARDPKNTNTIYAGTDGGAYVSFDSGQSWGQINDGLLGANVVYSIAVDPQSNVYAATPYGIFHLEKK